MPELIVCDQMDSGWSGTRRNFQSAAIVPLRGAKNNVQTNTCERSEVRTKVRFILPINRLPVSVRPLHILLQMRDREQMGFLHNHGGSPMGLASWEKANNRTGRNMLRPGTAVIRRLRNIAAAANFLDSDF